MTAFDNNLFSTNLDGILNLHSADLAALAQLTGNDLMIENEEVVCETSAVPLQIVQDISPMLGSSSDQYNIPRVRSQPGLMNPGRPTTQSTEDVKQPFVEIVEQPRQRGLRFRYQCEGRSAGSIPGQNSSAEKKTYPTIKICNHRGPAIIVVSCVSKDFPHKPHPHALVGRDCKKGVCTVKVKDTNVISFPHLGIQCAKKKGIQDSLDLRKKINVDPYQTGFDFPNTSAEMSVVKLCFQVFLPDPSGKITKVLPPVVSQAIHDKKALNDLVICRVDRSSGKAKGGDEVFLLCEKINKDDIAVRFYEEGRDGSLTWEAFGEFGNGDVHRQYAIVFKTPAYINAYINRPADTFMQLQRPSDGETSEPINFTYMPEDPDPDRIEEKRKRKAERMHTLVQDMNTAPRASGAHVNIKEGLRSKLKANRKLPASTDVKVETDVQGSGLPVYSLSNIGSASFAPSGSSFSYRTSDNSSLGNILVTNPDFQGTNAAGDSQVFQAYSVPVDSSQTTASFDTNMIDHQVLLEYLQDKGIDGRDILSFESLDMISGGTTEAILAGIQAVGANELVVQNVQDINMDSDNANTFSDAQDLLRGLQN